MSAGPVLGGGCLEAPPPERLDVPRRDSHEQCKSDHIMRLPGDKSSGSAAVDLARSGRVGHLF